MILVMIRYSQIWCIKDPRRAEDVHFYFLSYINMQLIFHILKQGLKYNLKYFAYINNLTKNWWMNAL